MNHIKISDSTGTLLKYLYQWDSGQNVMISGIDASAVTEVHFSHIDSDEALVVIPQIAESCIIAAVPNILLQRAAPIMMYVVCDPDNLNVRTISAGKITVVPKAKPVDYVYTETEVLSYRTLDARLKVLENEMDDAVELSANMGLVSPIAAEDGAVYTDENGDIYTL